MAPASVPPLVPASVPGLVAASWRLLPLKPNMRLTTASLGSRGRTGATAGLVPAVMTSGSYTQSRPVAGSRMVAWTKAWRFGLAWVHPEAAGSWPSGPVSW